MANDGYRLAAITFTDIVGYSTMIQSNEALTLELLEELDSLSAPFSPNMAVERSRRWAKIRLRVILWAAVARRESDSSQQLQPLCSCWPGRMVGASDSAAAFSAGAFNRSSNGCNQSLRRA